MTRWLGVLGLLLAAVAPVAAQNPPTRAGGGEAADTVDTFQAARDSARARQLRLLQDLSRTPGADSARLAADSARMAGPRTAQTERIPVVSAAGDSILGRLLDLPGYTSTQYTGLEAEYEAGVGILVLRGDSTTRAAFRGPDGTRTSSDSLIRYDQETGRMRTWGNVLSVPQGGNEVESRYLECDVETEICRAATARTSYSEGAEWFVTSDLPLIRSDVSYGHKAMFTSCELDEPHYHFEADNLKVVRGSILVAAPVRLYFQDVPVAWLPFIAQSLNTGRSSGILTPTFSVNDIVRTSGGYRRRVSNVGFYWAMNDYMDALVAMDWFDDNYTALTGSYRFRWLRQFLQGGVNFRQFWRAEGGSELTLDANANWQLSERTSFRARAQYASSSEFVTQNSFNPQEVTQSIDSEGGFNHRFDWGTLAVNGNRRQFLSDDRVETTFPSASLSLSSITLFRAPPNRASFFNNMAWSGGANFSASTSDYSEALGYIPGQQDRSNLRGGLRTSLNIQNLALSGSGTYSRGTTFGVREVIDSLAAMSMAERVSREGMAAFFTPLGRQFTGQPVPDSLLGPGMDLTRETVDWNATVNYQQNLIGSTTFTPRITLSGNYLRSSQIPEAQSFVAGPTRTSFGAQLRTDLYGFFPGVAGFDRIRHKISPSVSYDYSPETTPTPLQETVFGSRSVQPRNVVSVTLNQTFEAKRDTEADSAAAPGGPASASTSGEPRRLPRAEIVNLLSLRTSAVRYDFVEAEEFGFLNGFETVQLTNQISSDLLRGLSINMTHSLFEDVIPEGQAGDPDVRPTRTFDPQLTQMNLGFSLNNRSGIFRLLGLGGGGDEPDEEETEEEDLLGEDDPFNEEDPLSFRRTDESSMIPGNPSERTGQGPRRSEGSGLGNWSAQISYALSRPRTNPDAQSQMIQASLRLQPTAQWEMSWRTSYDLETGGFNDHSIRLSRDLHRWRANFDFLQTATGNWSFRFEVSLLDNEDLKFDYRQRQQTQFQNR